MSLWSKVKKGIVQAAQVLPGIAQALPSSKGLATAAGTLQRTAAVLQGGAIPGVPSPVAPRIGAMSMSFTPVAGGALPSFPALPGGGGGFVKTGLPVAAAVAGGRALVAAAPRLVAGGRALLARVSPRVAKALGWATVGGLVYDAAGNLQGKVATRRMNPLNAKAARRAIRRIKSVRKICQGIERSLPKQKSRGCASSRRASCR